jgi:TolA-binding protein
VSVGSTGQGARASSRAGALAALCVGAWCLAAAAPPVPAALDDAPAPEDREREARADRKRDESIEALKRLLARLEEDAPQKADLYFELAELTWEKSRALYRGEMEALFAAQQAADGGAEPRPDHRPSEVQRAETIRLDELVLRTYPTYGRRDEVLYNLAYNLQEAGRRDQAVARYRELLKVHPTSRFVPDVHVQLGNHEFDVAGSVVRARGHFEQALASGNPRVQSYALYKLAWCDLNQGDLRGALAKLQETVERAERQASERSQVELKAEALNDAVRVYVELQAPEEALAWYHRHASPRRLPALLQAVGEGLQAAGHHPAALRLFRALLEEFAGSDRAPALQRAMVRSAEGQHDRALALEQARVLSRAYLPGSPWWAGQEGHPEVQRAGLAVAEEAVRALANEYHLEAQRTARVETLRLARDASLVYLEAFATLGAPEDVLLQRSAAAEVLAALDDPAAAGALYEIVAASPASTPPGQRLVAGAAHAAVLAWDAAVKKERGQPSGDPARAPRLQRRAAAPPVPLTAAEARLVAACDAYVLRAAGEADAVDVAYRAAVIFQERGQVVEAARRLGQLIVSHPEERRSQDAAELALAALEERQQWQALEQLARQLRANPRLAPPGSEFARRLAGVVERSQYLYLDEVVVKREHDPARALPLLIAHQQEFPRSETADRALVYALGLAVELDQLDTAVTLGKRLLEAYPLSSFDLKVKYQLGHLEARLGDFEGAAAQLEDFVASYLRASGDPAGRGLKATSVELGALPEARRRERLTLLAECTRKGDDWVQNALYDLGVWREGLESWAAARAAWTRYLQRYPEAADAPAVAARQVELVARLGRPAEALEAARAHLVAFARDRRVSELDRLALERRALRLAEQLGSGAEVQVLALQVAARVARLPAVERDTDAARGALAHARFAQLEPAFRAALALRLTRLATFKEDLALKQRRVQELEVASGEVLALGDAEFGLAALSRLGLAYADLAARVAEAPAPLGLDEDQRGLFKSELQTRYVLPLEAKAAEVLEKAVAKAEELRLFGAWLTAAQDQLEVYRPGSFPPGRAVELPVVEPATRAEALRTLGPAGGAR